MKVLFVFLIAVLPLTALAQSANVAFHTASNQYIHEKTREAVATLESALQRYPSDRKLRELREKIKQDEQKKQQEQENQDQQNQEQQEQEQKDQENKDKQEQEQQKKEQQSEEEKKEQEKKEQEKQQKEQEQKDQEKKDNPNQNLDRQKLEQMKISEEKARMILEAMKNQEKQYLQQNKRKATKSRDRTKPDW